MSYDPKDTGHRMWLALALKSMMYEAGFRKVEPSVFEAEIRASNANKYVGDSRRRRRRYAYDAKVPPLLREEVWERSTPDPRIRIRVYTTIVGQEVRAVGTDAIRVQLVYKNGDKTQQLLPKKRVNRTGKSKAIIERTLTQMRAAFVTGKSLQKCHCGAPKFKSKKDNMVCADKCWLKK